MSTTLEELVVVLKGDSSHYESAMGEGIRLLTTMDTTAAKTAARLEQASKAFASPTAPGSQAEKEMALQEAVVAHQQQTQKEMLRERMAAMEAESQAAYQAAEQQKQMQEEIEQARIANMVQSEETEKELLRQKMARWETESQVAWESQEEQKQVQEEKQAQHEADTNMFLAWRQAVGQQETQMVAGLEDQKFRLTHNSLQIRMRDLQSHYQAQRAAAMGNAKALALIDEVYNMQKAQLERQAASQEMQQLLGRRGVARRLLQTTLPLAGIASGGMIGQVAMMASFQGLKVGAAMGVVMLFTESIKKAREEQEKLKKTLEEYNRGLQDTAKFWEEILRAQTPTTELGGRVESKRAQARKEWMDQEEHFRALLNAEQERTWGSSAGQIREIGQAGWIADQKKKEYEIQNELANKFRRIQLVRGIDDRAAAVEASRIATMYEGAAQKRRQTEFDLARDLVSVQRQNEDRLLAFDESVKEEQRLRQLEVVTMPRGFDETRWKDAGVEGQRRIYEESPEGEARRTKWLEQDRQWEEDRKTIVDDNAGKIYTANEIAANRRLALQQAEQVKEETERRSFEQSKINLNEEGYAKDLALLKEKHKAEYQEYSRHSPQLLGLLALRQDNEAALLRKNRDKNVDDQKRSMQQRIDVALGTRTGKQVEWENMERAFKEMGLTAGQIAPLQRLFDTMSKAEANRPLLDSVKQMRIEFDLLHKKITEVEAARRRLELAHPEADPARVRETAEMEHRLKLEQEAEEIRRRYHPEVVLKEYKKHLEDLMAKGLSGEDAIRAMKEKIAELYPGRNEAGEFREVRSTYMDIDAMRGTKIQDLISVSNGHLLGIRINTAGGLN